MDDLRDRHVVITGGTGALGSAVVGLLLARGAKCHVPCWNQKELEHFPYRAHDDVTVVGGINLANEGDVAELYGSLPVDSPDIVGILGEQRDCVGGRRLEGAAGHQTEMIE